MKRIARISLSRTPLIALAGLCLAGCHQGANSAKAPDGADAEKFAGISAAETLRFTGTEPFWGGSATGETLTYSTPSNPDGTRINVRRFSGNNGLGLSGTLDDKPFDMAVTRSICSDGMSDRSYPFTVTLNVHGELRQGCGWTDSKPFSGPQQP
ncbi:MAG: hypothetical protein WCY11_16730 [Novosphingobium sp.]